jgi:TrmH family RNA methyltransferase
MSTRSLTSKNNPLIKTIRQVATQARRAPKDLVLAEGVRALEEVMRARLEISAVLIADRFGSSDRERALRESLLRSDIRVYHVPDAALRQLSEVRTSQGILAAVRIPVRQLSDSILPGRPFLICAAGIQDPGNLGALIRTADAAGVSLVCSLAGTVSARNPKTVRASAGAIFRIPFVERLSPSEFVEFCRRNSILLLSSSAQGGTCYFREDLTGPCAILFGNEGSGIDESPWAAGVRRVHIPMAPGAESLNVAMAGAILMFEARRQRSSRHPRA